MFRRIALTVLTIAVLGYAGVLGVLFALQRSMIYSPAAERLAPAIDGLPIQEVELKTADGETLVAWYLPPQPDKPVFLVFNGNAAHVATDEGRWRRIADAGAGFLAVCYRGYCGSTGKPTETGLNHDADAGWAWLSARHRGEDIVIQGFSLGAAVATQLAARKEARALILEAPFNSMVDMARAQAPYVPARLVLRDQFRSAKFIKSVGEPVLIIHGDADSVVPFAQGQKLFEAAGTPKTFVRLHGSDHNTLTRDGAYDAIWAFLGEPVRGTAYKDSEAERTVRVVR